MLFLGDKVKYLPNFSHNMAKIGIDIGGTKISAATISNNKVKNKVSITTNAKGSEKEIISQITKLIDKLINKKIKSIGIAVPAIVDFKQGIVYETVNIPSWKKVKLKEIFENRYKKHHIKVNINNDANCFALGEKHFGTDKDYSNFVVLSIGTGLGAGIIINNQLYNGANCGAGEFGEIPYKRSKLENYCSGQYFLKKYKLTGKELYQKAKRKDKIVLKAFQEFGYHLGKALAIITHAYDPELIILGGSVSKAYPYFKKAMLKSLQESVYKQSYNKIKIKVSRNKDSILLGAGMLE
jgi:glucokinase